ncbi:MAG: glycosyltransferase [Thalassobaculaceae bacterium]
MGRPLVMFGEDWDGLPSSTRHLARRFAETRRVVWVNSIGLRRPRLTLSDGARAARKVAGMLRPRPVPAPCGSDGTQRALPENITVLDPKAVSWPGNPIAGAVNRRTLGAQLRRTLSDLRIDRPVLWTSLPTAVDVVGELNESAVVYYCCDDFSGLEGVDHGPVTRLEKRMVSMSDLVFTTNDALADKLSPKHHASLPHGVDADLFSQPADRPADLPEGKVAVFYGSLASWIDVPGLAALARQRPDWTLVLIGAVQTDLTPLDGLSNVRLLGSRPHNALPGYVQHADAALLPFRDTPQIRACNPLKLREYLASGSPVISTDFRALDPYREVVQVAGDVGGFASQLDRIDGSPEARERRLDTVRAETWEARARYALAEIDGIAK